MCAVCVSVYSGSVLENDMMAVTVCGDNNEIVAKLELNSLFYFHFLSPSMQSHPL